jgi:hypothetical protein
MKKLVCSVVSFLAGWLCDSILCDECDDDDD